MAELYDHDDDDDSSFRPRSRTMPTHLDGLPRKYRGIIKFVPHSNSEYVLVQIWERDKVVFRKECKKSTVKVFGRRVSFRWSVFTLVGTQDKTPDTHKIPQTMMHICRDIGAVKINPCNEHDIDLKGEREWVMFGPESDFVIDIQKGQTVLKRQSGADSQKWWREGGFIRNKAYPGKVLAVNWPASNYHQRPKGKLADLELVEEDRTAYNQRWIYNKDDRTLESGVPGRYVIDCWHSSGSLCVDGPVIVYQDLRSKRQQINVTYDHVVPVRPNSVYRTSGNTQSASSLEDLAIRSLRHPQFMRDHQEPHEDDDQTGTGESLNTPLDDSLSSSDAFGDLELDASGIHADISGVEGDRHTLDTSGSSCEHCGKQPALLPTAGRNREELQKVPNDLDLESVVDQCTPEQRTALYRHLKLAPNKVENVMMDNRDLGFREQNIAVLRHWRQTIGRKATRELVMSALVSSGNSEAAHKLEDKFINNNL